MKIRFLLLALFFLLQIILSGCWDYLEYEHMAQIIGVGFDYNKDANETTLTVQYISTSKQGKGGPSGGQEYTPSVQGIVHSATDKTYFCALEKLQEVIFKSMFFGYLKVVVIGEEAAKYKMMDIMELLDRTPAVRTTAYLVVSSSSAGDTLSTVDFSKSISSSQQIFNLIKLSRDTGAAFPVSIQDFAEMFAIGGWEAAAPRIITISTEPKKPDAKGGTHEDMRLDEIREGDQRLEGIAAFKGDQFVGWLDEKESFGYGWITGKKMQVYKTSKTTGGGKTEDILYYRISDSKSKMKVKVEQGKPVIYIDVRLEANLRKYYSSKGADFFTPQEVSDMEKKLSDSIRSEIEAALKKGQKEFRSDIFGFGFALFRKSPKLWKNGYEKIWADIFPDIPVNINVDTKVLNTDTTTRKLNLN